jgi:hypothetical protein
MLTLIMAPMDADAAIDNLIAQFLQHRPVGRAA